MQRGGLQISVYTCFSWEMVSNVDLDTLFDNRWDRNIIRGNAEEVECGSLHKNDKTSR
jgi:hypothetical protein